MMDGEGANSKLPQKFCFLFLYGCTTFFYVCLHLYFIWLSIDLYIFFFYNLKLSSTIVQNSPKPCVAGLWAVRSVFLFSYIIWCFFAPIHAPERIASDTRFWKMVHDIVHFAVFPHFFISYWLSRLFNGHFLGRQWADYGQVRNLMASFWSHIGPILGS